MKKLMVTLLACLLLCGCSRQDTSPLPPSEPPTFEATVSDTPKSVGEASQSTEDYEILNAWDLLDTAPLQIDGSWSYYCASVQTAQGEKTILARDNPKGNQEVLLELAQVGVCITYVKNSLQQSGGKRLYFTVPTETVGQNELYGFDLSKNELTQLLPAPCSNMVVPAEPPRALAGFGWLVYEDKVVGVDLAAGQPYQGSSLNSDLDGHFFYGVGAAFDTKYTVVEAVDGDVLTLKTIEYDSQSSAPEQTAQLYYSVSSERYTTEPDSNFAPSSSPATSVAATPPERSDGSCAASGCSASAQYGRFCVDHVCMANGCFDERYPGDRYCATHSDLVADAPEYACAWSGCTTRAKYGKYCDQHACRYETCVNPKLPDSKYCDQHAQSNLCKVSGCYNFVDGGGYCEEHRGG